jgi:hypothetical protein
MRAVRIPSLSLLGLIISISYSTAQNRNSNWCFGDSTGIHFDSLTTSLFTSSVKSRGSCTSISDSLGQLLFYTYTRAAMAGNTTLIKNKYDSIMNNGDNIVGRGWYEELCIVPSPGDINQYYLFTVGVTGTNLGLYYSIVDMSMDSGRGDVVQKNIQLQSYAATDCIKCIKHGNGRDWWIISRRSDSSNDEFYEYLISPFGIAGPYIFNQGSQTSNNAYCIAFNKLGDKFAAISARGLIEIFDFDRCTGSINFNVNIRPESIPVPWLFGVAISPNSRFLYVSQTGISTPSSYLFQFDLNAPVIANSVDTLWQYDSIFNAAGSLRLAPNDKIYLASAWNDGMNYNYPYPDSVFDLVNNNLSVVNLPDSLGSSCDFQPFSFNLGSGRCYWGLPNNPDYELNTLQGSFCDSLTVSIYHEIPNRPEVNVFFHAGLDIIFINGKFSGGTDYDLSIFDSSGKLIFSTKGRYTSDYFVSEIPFNDYSNGLYFVQVNSGEISTTKKFIKN